MDEFDPRKAATDLLAAFVSNNMIALEQMPAALATLYSAITTLGAPVGEPATVDGPVPKVSVEASTRDPDFIVSLITGEKLKTLKRHLKSHGLTPSEYRKRFNLPRDYPMVAPAYSQHRRDVAERLGLGRRAAPAEAASPHPDADVQAVAAPDSSQAPLPAPAAVIESVSATPPKAKPARNARSAASKPRSARPAPSVAAPKPATEPAAAGKPAPARRKKAKAPPPPPKPLASTQNWETLAQRLGLGRRPVDNDANANEAGQAAPAEPADAAAASGQTATKPRRKLSVAFGASRPAKEAAPAGEQEQVTTKPSGRARKRS